MLLVVIKKSMKDRLNFGFTTASVNGGNISYIRFLIPDGLSLTLHRMIQRGNRWKRWRVPLSPSGSCSIFDLIATPKSTADPLNTKSPLPEASQEILYKI